MLTCNNGVSDNTIRPRPLVKACVRTTRLSLSSCHQRWKLWVQLSSLCQSVVRIKRGCASFLRRGLDQWDMRRCRPWPQQTLAEIRIWMNLFSPSSILILSYFTLILALFVHVLSRRTSLLSVSATLHFLTSCFFPNDPLLLSPLLLPQTPKCLCFFYDSQRSRWESYQSKWTAIENPIF